MNRIYRPPHLTPIEADYARWCAEQGALLRSGRLGALDRANLAEEIESLGRSDKREIENRLSVLLVHLLKWRFQQDKRSSGWRGTIREQRSRLARILADSPSLAGYPGEIIEDEYQTARLKASDETGLPVESFPATCPFKAVDVLDDAFLPLV